MATRKYNEQSDDAFDKRNKIPDGSKKDRALDRSRGLPADKPAPRRKK